MQMIIDNATILPCVEINIALNVPRGTYDTENENELGSEVA